MNYRESHWMTDTPQGREVALTWDGERYMVRQFEPRCRAWFPTTRRALHWRPLPPPPGGVDVSAWCAVEDER